MFSAFDIFCTDENGVPMWVEACPSIDDAKKRVGELGASHPGKYIILDQRTSHKLVVMVRPIPLRSAVSP
jgi:hypothetical protein